MCHGMNGARRALPFLGQQQQQTVLALLLWVQLSLCFGPVQLSVGFEDLATCPIPEVPENGYRTQSISVFFENAVVRFHCQNGYRLKGPSKKMCVLHNNGSLAWRPSDTPVCLIEVTDCLAPYIEDADVLNKTYRTSDKLIMSCRDGFQTRYPDLDNMASVCQDDGSWENLPLCQGCLRPLVLPHSYVNISDFDSSFAVGRVVSYQCFPGYKLEGAEYLECMYNLIWSDEPPRCLDVEVCPLPPMVAHGDYICHPQPCERYIHGTVIEFYCDPGYILSNDYKYFTCQSGEWFPTTPLYCVKSEKSWPNTQETMLTTWKIVAFTASSVLLVLLLVIIARNFQTKFKTHFLPRSPQDSSAEPDFVVVDGVLVMLPSYDEAVSSRVNVTPPGYASSAGQRSPTQTEESPPPAYPGNPNSDSICEESETFDSLLDSSDLAHTLHSSSMTLMRTPGTQNLNSEAASTSPSIDIADEIPLMDEEVPES
ncbi:PREDICTED: sushi domain-containing protein 4 [Nanorana parkeri]|uniref:sushi domain-containing protein 4 n=1 Tax=Nanorana parkeri TaxID=125878 RepID=UPI000854DE64|nr:PREDICTED: sushi domain-containing protein 4 [Nanorana parkeri]XP_018412028.1 PREDICTED: sushi domain-containing protein 4 [Nanorana parkeri]